MKTASPKPKGPRTPASRRILVPTDFSPTALHALRYAAPLARQIGGKITLLHVLDWPVIPATLGLVTTDEARLLAAAEQSLRRLAEQTVPPELLDKNLVRAGRAHQVIVEVARRQKTHVIVMATQGRTGFSRALLGSTAERVVRHASCPVLTVRPTAKKRLPRLKSESLASRINRILLPVDFSERSRPALRFAIRLAQIMNARLALLHVLAPLPITSAKHQLQVRQCGAEARVQARAKLQALAAAVPPSLKPQQLLYQGVAHQGITDAACRWRSDLVVLPTRGATPAAYIVLGSTAEVVVRHAPCPVLTFSQAPRQW